MKELEIRFEGRGEMRGATFTQLHRNDKAYMYMLRHEEGTITYEVFERKENTRFLCVSYPNSNAFGHWAWCYEDEHKARRKFNELTNAIIH